MHACICTHARMHTCTHAHMHTHIYMYIYIYTHNIQFQSLSANMAAIVECPALPRIAWTVWWGYSLKWTGCHSDLSNWASRRTLMFPDSELWILWHGSARLKAFKDVQGTKFYFDWLRIDTCFSSSKSKLNMPRYQNLISDLWIDTDWHRLAWIDYVLRQSQICSNGSNPSVGSNSLAGCFGKDFAAFAFLWVLRKKCRKQALELWKEPLVIKFWHVSKGLAARVTVPSSHLQMSKVQLHLNAAKGKLAKQVRDDDEDD